MSGDKSKPNSNTAVVTNALESFLRKRKEVMQEENIGKIKRNKGMDFVYSESESDTEQLSARKRGEQEEFKVMDKHLRETSVVHISRPSMLSSESSGVSFRGFLNLVVLLLFFSNIRLVITNLQKYGLLVNPAAIIRSFYGDPHSWPSASLFLGMNIWILIGFAVEKFASKYPAGNEKLVLGIHTLNIAGLLYSTIAIILELRPNPAFSIMNMLMMTVLFMKLWSYAAVNREMRLNKNNNADKKILPKGWVQYPDNIYLKDLYYFIAAPTLVYELNYPRSARIRKGWLMRRVFEFLFFSAFIIFMVEQYIMPLVQNAMQPFSSFDIVNIAERVLKLAVPNLFVWLLGFYTFFHLYLNIIAELLRFGDRMFYRDWWNSTTIDYFWRSWNIPVHRWMFRHVYVPMISSSSDNNDNKENRKTLFTRNQASLVVFLLSAVFHELVVCVPFAMFHLYSFMGMMVQLPMMWFTKRYTKGSQSGNIIFWLSIMLGHSNAVLLYYYDYFTNK